MNLNQRAHKLCDLLIANADQLRVHPDRAWCGTRLVDCGIKVVGGLEAGRQLAEVCMSGLGQVSLVPAPAEVYSGPGVMVQTDSPLLACMASQYAGWEIKGENYFAMGSGPMRAVAGREQLLADIDYRERGTQTVGVLESTELPPDGVCEELAAACGITAQDLTLLVAPTSSIAGTIQVVARSVETALHKLHELKFDLRRVQSAWGLAPLPPVGADTLTGIGRTNDAILYGGHAVLYVTADDELIAELGPTVPSSAAPDHGQPFKEIFARYDHDFYKIDPALFSPAVVTFVNLTTGRSHRFGQFKSDVLATSFAG